MRAYPATLTPDPDEGFTITFRDVPEAITEGDSREKPCCARRMRSSQRWQCMWPARSRCQYPPRRRPMR
jgi:hypothetical protein